MFEEGGGLPTVRRRHAPRLAPQPVQQEAAPVPPAVVVVDRAADVPDLVPRGQDLFALDDSGGGGTATAGS